MAPSRRKGGSKAAAAAAARRQWKVGDLVLAKVKGFPAWPAKVCAMRYFGEKLGFFLGNFAGEVYASARVLDSMWIYFVSLCMLSSVGESWGLV